jgi:hypothetical protein
LTRRVLCLLAMCTTASNLALPTALAHRCGLVSVNGVQWCSTWCVLYVCLLQNCLQLPLELSGTVGVGSVGVNTIKASYSNYGSLFVQVSCLYAMCPLR